MALWHPVKLSLGGKVLLDIKDGLQFVGDDYIDEIAQAVANVGFPPEDVFGWIGTRAESLLPEGLQQLHREREDQG